MTAERDGRPDGPPVERPIGRLAGHLIGLGVTGSIAAYKAVELLRLLRAEGADVAVMLTPAATRFVGPLSFAALSRHPVETELLDLLPNRRGAFTEQQRDVIARHHGIARVGKGIRRRACHELVEQRRRSRRTEGTQRVQHEHRRLHLLHVMQPRLRRHAARYPDHLGDDHRGRFSGQPFRQEVLQRGQGLF